jgi:hypothetical protein
MLRGCNRPLREETGDGGPGDRLPGQDEPLAFHHEHVNAVPVRRIRVFPYAYDQVVAGKERFEKRPAALAAPAGFDGQQLLARLVGHQDAPTLEVVRVALPQ